MRQDSSRARRIILGYPKGLDGKPVCRWCRGPVPKGRQCWCGDKCVEEYRARNDPAYMRHRVFERDQGICQVCGLDLVELRRRIQEIRGRAGVVLATWYEEAAARRANATQAEQDWAEYRHWLVRVGFRRWWRGGGLWQADHRVEVAAGGAELGLQNLQVVCTVCHRAKTAEFARRRAVERRLSGQPELSLN